MLIPPQIIFGYHGCDESTLRMVLEGGVLRPSENAYDWLGHGIYFWERSPVRAMRWAQDMAQSPHATITKPAVVGAVINLGHCLDLGDPESGELVAQAHAQFIEDCEEDGIEPPRNKGRFLDCAVMNHLHTLREESGQPPFDTVRGFFNEGQPVYPTAGLRSLDHVQVCIRNRACVMGFFRPALA